MIYEDELRTLVGKTIAETEIVQDDYVNLTFTDAWRAVFRYSATFEDMALDLYAPPNEQP